MKHHNMGIENNGWKNEYLTAMMSEDFERGLGLKALHFPTTFFKYRKFNVQSTSIITGNRMWLADISTLNDPFECSIQFDNDECLRMYLSSAKFLSGFTKQFGFSLNDTEVNSLRTAKDPYQTYLALCKTKHIEIQITAEQQLDRIQKRWTEIILETNRDIRITCFSERNDSLLMWSHYAEDHKGICLEYDFINEHKIRPFLQPVIYDDKVHKIAVLEDLTMIRKIGSSLIKSMDWQYEQEWRLTIFRQGTEFPKNIQIPDPKAVYLGTRFNENEEGEQKQFFDMLALKKIPVYEMKKHPTEYKLIKKQI